MQERSGEDGNGTPAHVRLTDVTVSSGAVFLCEHLTPFKVALHDAKFE